MRTTLYFLGFLTFGLTLFALIGDTFEDLAWTEQNRQWVWLIAIGLLIADIFIPIPTTMIITAMGQRYGLVPGAWIGIVGTFSAGVIAYGLTRMLGIRFAKWLLGDELEKVEKLFEERGSFAVACSRWLPLIPEAVSCLAGLARMHFGRYCLALLSGVVPMSIAYAVLAGISDNKTVPLIVSAILPIPIWWIAARLLMRTRQA